MGVGTPVDEDDVIISLTGHTHDIHGGVSIACVLGGVIVNGVIDAVLVTEVLQVAVLIHIGVVADKVHPLGLHLAVVQFRRLAIQQCLLGSNNTLCTQHGTEFLHVGNILAGNSRTGVGMGGGHQHIVPGNTGLLADRITDKIQNSGICTLQVPGHKQHRLTIGAGHCQCADIEGIMDRGGHSVRGVCGNAGNGHSRSGGDVLPGKAYLEALYRGCGAVPDMLTGGSLLLGLGVLLGACQQ